MVLQNLNVGFVYCVVLLCYYSSKMKHMVISKRWVLCEIRWGRTGRCIGSERFFVRYEKAPLDGKKGAQVLYLRLKQKDVTSAQVQRSHQNGINTVHSYPDRYCQLIQVHPHVSGRDKKKNDARSRSKSKSEVHK